MSKVTMQDIADELGISRVTVWKVFNNHSGVSEAVRESVLQKAKELGYSKFMQEPASIPNDPQEDKTVSLIVSRPDSSTFWTNIIHRLAQELATHNINLLYTYVPSSYTPSYSFPSALTNGTVSGAIILNVYDTKMVTLINDTLKIPKVFLDTVPEVGNRALHGDLLLIEGYNTMYEITQSILERGITNIGFIGDIHYAITNKDRYIGFCHCLKDHNIPLNPAICHTDPIGIFSYHNDLYAFLDSIPELPQAFICASDYIAHFLHLYLTEHPERIPNGIILTGFDGSNEYTNINGLLTTAYVHTSLLGKRLSLQIIYRMDHPDAPFELTYISPEIVYRDSIVD